MNKWLLVVGALLALGALVLAVRAQHFDARLLAVNLAAIAIGLVMGKYIGRFIFRRVLPRS